MVAGLAALVRLRGRWRLAVGVFPTDILFWCGGSLAAAMGAWWQTRWEMPVACILCGAIAASVLHAATLAIQTRAGWPGVLLMVPALLISLFFAWHSIRAA